MGKSGTLRRHVCSGSGWFGGIDILHGGRFSLRLDSFEVLFGQGCRRFGVWWWFGFALVWAPFVGWLPRGGQLVATLCL